MIMINDYDYDNDSMIYHIKSIQLHDSIVMTSP